MRKFTDEQIITAVHECREAADQRHGPVSLEHLAEFMLWRFKDIEFKPSRAALSVRINQLIDGGYLHGMQADKGTVAMSLEPKSKGYKLIGVNPDDIEPAGPADT